MNRSIEGSVMRNEEPARRSHTVAELRARRADADRRAAQWFSAAAILAACALGWLSLLFAMMGDACKNDVCGHEWVGALVYPVTWGGMIGGVTLVVLGGRPGRKPPVKRWPAAGLVLIVVSFVAGLLLANSLAMR